MDLILRLMQLVVKFLYIIIAGILSFALPKKPNASIPPIKNMLLTLPLSEIVLLMRAKKLKSQELVQLYIERIKEVNPFINALVEERFKEALIDAKRADDLISKCGRSQLSALYTRHPILGVPFTVKESCGVKGMSFVVGSLQRTGLKAERDNVVVENLRAAGGILLLVSANPEYCFSMETTSYTNGKCLNPYDFRRTSGGSSGGEGALNGSGASLFGIGSDISGSIRIPCLFNGVFGHKPTGGLIPNDGVFPSCDNSDCLQYLQSGPITRFGCDLSLILHIMAGQNASKLEFAAPIDIRQIKIFYLLGFTGLNGFLHHSVSDDIQISILKAVQFFKRSGLSTELAKIKGLENSTEIGFSAIARLQTLPYLMNDNPSIKDLMYELMKSTWKGSQYTKEGLTFELLRRTNAFMTPDKLNKYKKETEELKKEIIALLGTNGVLFFPSFPTPAIHHHCSALAQWAIDYPLIFNVLGLPTTHIPMGLDSQGLPIGFQVIAAPYKDKLCLQLAGALEATFGGWTPPVKHEF